VIAVRSRLSIPTPGFNDKWRNCHGDVDEGLIDWILNRVQMPGRVQDDVAALD